MLIYNILFTAPSNYYNIYIIQNNHVLIIIIMIFTLHCMKLKFNMIVLVGLRINIRNTYLRINLKK